MPSVSLLEQSFARSRDNDLAAFRAAQMLGGGGADPFGAPLNGSNSYVNCFEHMTARLVPVALSAIAGRKHLSGAIEVNLKRPTVDEKLAGKVDFLCSDDPMFWVSAALAAGLPVIRYIVEVNKRRLAIIW